jgi:RimJ/RimL family protein N-acetyltransferase
MIPLPPLQGNLLNLRPLQKADFDVLLQAASDRLIWEQHPEPTRYQKPVFQKYFDSGIASGGAFLIQRKDTQQVVGCSRFYEYFPEKKEIKVGYTFLIRDCWGGNYNRELKQLMLAHAFSFVDTVLFEVGAENKRSRRALEKIGARFLTQREDSEIHGYPVVKTTYGMTRAEFQANANLF